MTESKLKGFTRSKAYCIFLLDNVCCN